MDSVEKYEYWEDIAKYDLDTAKAMLASGRYLYVAFMCQQAIEKLVKGLHILYLEEEAPRTHNIWIVFKKIIDSASFNTIVNVLELSDKIEKHKTFFADLLFYYISERYPSYKEKLSSSIDQEKANKIFAEAEEVFLWLQSLNQYKK